MNRRQFLATGTTAALATVGGCTGCATTPSAAISMTAVTDAEIARRVTHRLEADPDNERYQLVGEIVETDNTIIEATEQRLPTDGPLVYEGTVYELSVRVLETTPARSFSFTLDPVEGTVTDAATVRFDALPAVDRAKFREHGLATDPFLGIGSAFVYPESEIATSALVPEPVASIIVWDADTRGRFTVDGSRSLPIYTYCYTAEVVRESAAAYGRDVRRENVFRLTGLSTAEQELVSKAIAGDAGYTVPAGEQPSEAFRSLAARFRPHDDVEQVWEQAAPDDAVGTAAGTYLVRYDGDVYWTDLQTPVTATETGGTQ
ncbi:hypothetical protein [Halosegnis sp.]|uniref:hypothetical protein n=1 Tax=Halosegnis sp. TaxID=2864959 RepID=UPI0035D51D16